MDINELYKSLTILTALKSNVASIKWSVDEKYVKEFRSVLGKLKGIGIQVDDFEVPNSEIKPRQTSYNCMRSQSTYSREKYIDKHFLLTKMDSVLNYLNLILEK
jgi:hypothetical protein